MDQILEIKLTRIVVMVPFIALVSKVDQLQVVLQVLERYLEMSIL